MKTISALIPVRWAIDGVDAMMYRGEGLTDAAKPIGALVVFSILFAGIAVARMRKA